MQKTSTVFSNKEFPQNYILRKPIPGVFIIALFSFLFLLLYQPLNAHETGGMSYAATMALYCAIAAGSVFGFIYLLKKIPFFSKQTTWTFTKEIISILLVSLGLGIAIYFAAFLIEPPANRWNFETFFDSLIRSFLIFIIPFAFFTATSYYFWITQQTHTYPLIKDQRKEDEEGAIIQIQSRLKKEKLSFFPSQFLYAESDGNYVNFYLEEENVLKKKIIRNSIQDIEQQLASIPYIFRTHRAFLVNLKKIKMKQGNTSGYRLKLEQIDAPIPVSRKKTKTFNEKLNHIHS
jgi:hypothetical protein